MWEKVEMKRIQVIVEGTKIEDVTRCLRQAADMVEDGVTSASCHPDDYDPYLCISIGAKSILN